MTKTNTDTIYEVIEKRYDAKGNLLFVIVMADDNVRGWIHIDDLVIVDGDDNES